MVQKCAVIRHEVEQLVADHYTERGQQIADKEASSLVVAGSRLLDRCFRAVDSHVLGESLRASTNRIVGQVTASAIAVVS
jgi:hypothetical protein